MNLSLIKPLSDAAKYRSILYNHNSNLILQYQNPKYNCHTACGQENLWFIVSNMFALICIHVSCPS